MRPEDQLFDGVVFRYVSRHGSRELRESFRMLTGDSASDGAAPRANETLAATYVLKAQRKLGPIRVFSREVRSTASREVAVREIFGRNTSITVLANQPRGVLADRVPPMAESEFWPLIAAAKDRRGRFSVVRLTESLSDRDPDVILAFAVRLSGLLHALDVPELESAIRSASGALIMSEDASLDYRAWLVLQGQETVSKAMQYPASAPRPDGKRRSEELLTAPSEAYSIRTGESVTILVGLDAAATGEGDSGREGGDTPQWQRDGVKPFSEYQDEIRVVFEQQRNSHWAPDNLANDDVWWDVNFLHDWIGVRYLTSDGAGLFVEHLDVVGQRLHEDSWRFSASTAIGFARAHAESRAIAAGHELVAIDVMRSAVHQKDSEVFRIHRRSSLSVAEYTEKYID